MAQAQFLPHRRYVARLGILLVLALVFAQTGAVLHAYSHTHASPHRTQTTDSGAPGPAGQVCSDCLSFAPLLTAAGGTAQPENSGTVSTATDTAANGLSFAMNRLSYHHQRARPAYPSRAAADFGQGQAREGGARERKAC